MKYDENYFEGKESPYFEHGGYEKAREKHLKYFFSILDFVKMLGFKIRNGRGKKVLDVGCAYGYHLLALKEMGYRPYGIDITSYAIKKARKNLGRDANVFVQDACKPFPFDERFDLIICIETLEHLPKLEDALRNIYNSLIKGGIFLATTPSRWMLRQDIYFKAKPAHINVNSLSFWKSQLKKFSWRRLCILPLQSFPLIWRLGYRKYFPFPLGTIILIGGIK